jgi:preprotein translocase SecE subunit
VAKTVGKGKSYSLRGRISAEPEADLVDSSSDDPGDEDMDDARDDDFEDDDFEDDTADEPSSRSEVLAPSDIPVELHRVEGRPRAPIAFPEWVMANPVTRYAAESFNELWSNTTWPTMRAAWNFTLIVIVMAAFVGIILGVADLGLTQLLTAFLRLGK